MPYLNWKDAALQQEVLTAEQSGGSREFQLKLNLAAEQLQELIPHLQEIYEEEGAELRVDLPREWIMFWKLRVGESRLLMAHPQPEEWVSTMALSAAHGKRLIEALQGLSAGETLSIEKLGSTGSMTNVEVLLTRT
jgi:hypothetical protein